MRLGQHDGVNLVADDSVEIVRVVVGVKTVDANDDLHGRLLLHGLKVLRHKHARGVLFGDADGVFEVVDHGVGVKNVGVLKHCGIVSRHKEQTSSHLLASIL